MNLLTAGIREDGEYLQFLEVLEKQLRGTPHPLLISGLGEGAGEAFVVSGVSDTARMRSGAVLLICADEKQCGRYCNLLRAFGMRAETFFTRDLNFYDMAASHEYEQARLRVLFGLLSEDLDAVVTTPDACLGYTVPPDIMIASGIRVTGESTVNPAVFAHRLTEAGYARVDLCEAPGQFAVRGGIVDVYPPYGRFEDADGATLHGAHALRIELWDDSIDRMGIFDPETQRVRQDVTSAELPPSREVLAQRETLERLRAVVKQELRQAASAEAEETFRRELSAVETALESGTEVPFLDKYLSLVYPEKKCLLSYFGEKDIIFLLGYGSVRDRLKGTDFQNGETVKQLAEAGLLLPKYAEYSAPTAQFDAFLEGHATVCLDSMARGLSGKTLGGVFSFRTRHTVSYSEKTDLLTEDARQFLTAGYRVTVAADSELFARNLCGVLNDSGIPAVVCGDEDVPAGNVAVIVDRGIPGYENITLHTVLLSTLPDATTRHTHALRTPGQSKKSAAGRILSFADLKVGDYVVHESYGIGQYLGIQNLLTDGVRKDYIAIRYAGAEKLYIPVEKLDLVSKYIGARGESGEVKLSHYGSGAWEKTKSRVRAAVKDMAKDLIRLYAERARKPGIAFPADDDFQRDFESAFEYEETDSQLQASEEIKADMMRPVPMDRLLCGDVGFGKTEVALRAAYKAILGGKQVAILVPTTLLALQHYQTATSRMRPFAVHVDMVSRFRTPRRQNETLKALAAGGVDLIIGTHRLLSSDIKFKNLGLLIVDEEQRFGVAQKEKLKQMASDVDVLTLSATPIPRTLNMAMGGIRDISVLDEAPGERQPVQTYVLEYDDAVITEAIRRELNRGGQVFYLYNDVETIEHVSARLRERLPDARITVAHGQMDKEMLEGIWERMLNGEIDVLVCTTIIETGVDIPNANTLIVENAHRMGLSQLHQIRGRVGRSARRAYAYLTVPRGRTVSEIAEKRLNAIREYAEFGAGFRIALRDMEIRGAGNLLGAEQHGHMESVGYDLYIKLLNEAVLEEKGVHTPEKQECKILLRVDAYLPETYVPNASLRMALYHRIAEITSEEERCDLYDELLDRFGEVPRPAEQLLGVALVRALAEASGIRTIAEDNGTVVLTPGAFAPEDWLDACAKHKDRFRLVTGGMPTLRYRPQKGDRPLTQLAEFLSDFRHTEKEES